MTQRFPTPSGAAQRLARGLLSRLRPLRQAARWPRYLLKLLLGQQAGDYQYRFSGEAPADPWRVEVKLAAEGASAVDLETAEAWCARQTLAGRRALGELSAAGYDSDGQLRWRAGTEIPSDASPEWFMAPGVLPEVSPAFVESCLMVAVAEEIEAVALLEGQHMESSGATSDLATELRPFSLFSDRAYRRNPVNGEVRPRIARRRIKVVTDSAGEEARNRSTHSRRCRGPYISSTTLPPRFEVGLRDLNRAEPTTGPSTTEGGKTRLLITVPFLARGGAEHTLFETARIMAREFEISIATLAPHRPELGDRREDFLDVTPRIYCLGDLVHPAAMPGLLGRLLDELGIEIVYNANSTTLFYDFFPRLKAERPGLRIVDHLYDHRIGYIDRYEDPELLTWLDACVAENRKIAATLIDERCWPADRVPVIWPCGRAADAFPTDMDAARRDARRELGLGNSDVIVLTAARMHEQKRPLDLVALAERVRDLDRIQFLVVGGGDLESQVDAAIDAAGETPIRRLPFRTDIPRLIAAADVGCLISEHEGLPVFMLECLQAGRPFLGTDVGEMAAQRRDGAHLE